MTLTEERALQARSASRSQVKGVKSCGQLRQAIGDELAMLFMENDRQKLEQVYAMLQEVSCDLAMSRCPGMMKHRI